MRKLFLTTSKTRLSLVRLGFLKVVSSKGGGGSGGGVNYEPPLIFQKELIQY